MFFDKNIPSSFFQKFRIPFSFQTWISILEDDSLFLKQQPQPQQQQQQQNFSNENINWIFFLVFHLALNQDMKLFCSVFFSWDKRKKKGLKLASKPGTKRWANWIIWKLDYSLHPILLFLLSPLCHGLNSPLIKRNWCLIKITSNGEDNLCDNEKHLARKKKCVENFIALLKQWKETQNGSLREKMNEQYKNKQTRNEVKIEDGIEEKTRM